MRDKLNGAIVGAACTAFIVLLSVGFGFFLGEHAETSSNPAESEAEAPAANLTAMAIPPLQNMAISSPAPAQAMIQ